CDPPPQRPRPARTRPPSRRATPSPPAIAAPSTGPSALAIGFVVGEMKRGRRVSGISHIVLPPGWANYGSPLFQGRSALRRRSRDSRVHRWEALAIGGVEVKEAMPGE